MSEEPPVVVEPSGDAGEGEPAEKPADTDGDPNAGGDGDGEEKEVKEETEQEEADLEKLKEELATITVEPPKIEIPEEHFDTSEFPDSYRENLPKEKLVLVYAENFRRQYVHLYRDRKPLFLNPVNECRTEKFVCTTIRPTQLPFKEVYDWDGASEFVSDYLNFEALNPPTDLPKRLLSPTTVLKRQKGNCFEYSTLLCSLLIGNGYDAYVVSGYANKETCLMDETREICPILKPKVEVKKEEKKKEVKKYTVKPPKDLRSKFEIKQENRRIAELEAEEAKRKQEELDRIAELEKPPPDPLHGLRIHSWVLVLAGKREVAESFFIEPFTGLSHPLDSENYLGIESVWNDSNYWVNMQDCSNGVKGLKYDLGDCTLWEFMFPSNEKPKLDIPEIDDDLDDDDEEEEEIEKHLDMPPSWVNAIRIAQKDFEMRCPQGKKTKLYKKAKLEKFAHYLLKDGLTSKLSVYDDKELKDMIQVREFFNHREDKLYTRTHNHRTGWIVESFMPGRPRCLKEHTYRASTPQPENDRTMIFYHEARVDGLVKREESPTEMTEHFIKRDDFLYYRHVLFGKRPKKFVPADGPTTRRPILRISEKYNRNPEIPANEDIAELVFNIQEEKILITYHTEDDRISASTREYLKPHNADEKGATLIMTQDMHQTFQVDPTGKPKKQVELYQSLEQLLQREEETKVKVEDSENEVKNILDDRDKEEMASELEISVYDTARNEKAKKHRKELERLELEEKMRRQEMEIDYLAPFLAEMGDPEKINKQMAYKLKENCLSDLKKRLIDKANLIQARFEKETEALQKKQQWYQQNQVSMTKDDELEYVSYCSDMMFRLNIFESRLNRHKEMAPAKYMQLEKKIKTDTRLAEYF